MDQKVLLSLLWLRATASAFSFACSLAHALKLKPFFLFFCRTCGILKWDPNILPHHVPGELMQRSHEGNA